ncbi:hypothetical protein GCM10028800_22440 [Nesterenkonia populi]
MALLPIAGPARRVRENRGIKKAPLRRRTGLTRVRQRDIIVSAVLPVRLSVLRRSPVWVFTVLPYSEK